MGDLTTRLDLYKPGGGSTGLILPDEAADIDKINDNMDILDAAMGAFICTSGTRPGSPFDGQIIYETDTKKILVYKSAGAVWQDQSIYEGAGRGNLAREVTASPATLTAISDPLVGDRVRITTPGTGISEFWAECFAGSGATADWRPGETIIADTKANLDTFIAAWIADTDLTFRIGGEVFVTGTSVLYRFTSTAGAYRTVAASVPIIPTLTGTGGTSAVDAVTGEVTFSGAITAIRVNSTVAILSTFRYVEMILRYTGSVAGSHTTQLTLAAAIAGTSEYRLNGVWGGASTSPAAAANFSQGYVGNRRNRRRIVNFFNLADALATMYVETGADGDPGASYITGQSGGEHNVATAYDGIVVNLVGLTTLSNGSLQLIGHY